jgi:hypothetical protein
MKKSDEQIRKDLEEFADYKRRVEHFSSIKNE